MRPIVLIVPLLFAVQPARAQGVADLFRSVTGALRGGAAQQAPAQQGATPVLGVRGMDEADAGAKAKPAVPSTAEDYTLLEGWAATKAEAEHAAKARGLAARAAALKVEAGNDAASNEPKTP